MKLAVVTDSSAYISDHYKKHEDLYILPLSVVMGGKSYEEDIDITQAEFYPLAKASKDFPSTSQPAVGEILALFERLKNNGYDTVLCIHLSGKISGFGMSLASLKTAVAGLDVQIFDSQITSFPMGQMVEAALAGIDQNQTLAEISAQLAVIRETMRVFIIVEDLNNLVRGGRLTNGAALVGSLLKIKPILTFSNGQIVLYEKIRSLKKALAATEATIQQLVADTSRPLQLFVIHGNNPELAEQEKIRLSQQYPELEITVCSFGPVIGTHLGEKAIAIGVCAK